MRGSVGSAALRASNCPASVSLRLMDVVLLPRRARQLLDRVLDVHVATAASEVSKQPAEAPVETDVG